MKNNAAQIQYLTRIFAVLSDKTRLNIVLCLLKESRTVNEIHQQLGIKKITLSAISHQLSLLTALRIVNFEKKGRSKIFCLSKQFCWCILKRALKHTKHEGHCPACQQLHRRACSFWALY